MSPPGRSPRGSSGVAAIAETVGTIVIALALAWVIQAFLVKPYRIPTGSMENTLLCKDRVLVDRISYRFHKPHRSDVVVFRAPHKPGAKLQATINDSGERPWKDGDKVARDASSQTFIKRLVGAPGDRIQLKDRHLYVNGKAANEPYLHPDPGGQVGAPDGVYDFGPVTVPKGTWFMMGDNRTASRDSRWIGPIDGKLIIGKAFGIYWPLAHAGGIPRARTKGPRSSFDDPQCQEGMPQ